MRKRTQTADASCNRGIATVDTMRHVEGFTKVRGTDTGWQRLRSACCVLVLFGGVAVAAAQSYVSPMALVGRWSVSSRSAEGKAIETQVVFTQNKRFQGFSTNDGQSFVEFRGSWS